MDFIILANFSHFLGRFHPALVHLPIGFLLLAVLFEWFSKKNPNENFGRIITYTWFLGMITAIAASVVGWLLANHGTYGNWTLFSHRWLGIAVAIIATVVWLQKTGRINYKEKVQNILNWGVVLFLLIGGHLGGNMTHGEGYLVEHAPNFIKSILGESTEEKPTQFIDPDSTQIYADLLEPVFDNSCYGCHNENTQKGGLDMSSPEALLKGGDGGSIFSEGKPYESELFIRVTLPQSSRKFMPVSGTPLTYDQVKILEWWIATGHSFEASVADVEIPDDIKIILLRTYGLDTEPKPFYEKMKVAALTEDAATKIKEQGFKLAPLASTNNFVEVTTSSLKDTLSLNRIQALSTASEQITWLDLASSQLTNEMLEPIGGFKNLTRLELQKNSISDEGITHLEGLERLESLNLYGTNVTDAVFESIKKMPALKKIYLWQTQVTKEAVESFRNERPELDINTGIEL